MLIRKETLTKEETTKLIDTINELISKMDDHYKQLDGTKDLKPEDNAYKNQLNDLIQNLNKCLGDIKYKPEQ